MLRLTPSKVATLVGVNVETLRYYERIGLLPTPKRTAGGHRVYSQKDLDQLQFIRRARLLRFSLDEIRALLSLADPSHRLEVRKIAVERLQKLQTELAEKQQAAELLKHSIMECEAHTCGCQIIDMLKDENFPLSGH